MPYQCERYLRLRALSLWELSVPADNASTSVLVIKSSFKQTRPHKTNPHKSTVLQSKLSFYPVLNFEYMCSSLLSHTPYMSSTYVLPCFPIHRTYQVHVFFLAFQCFVETFGCEVGWTYQTAVRNRPFRSSNTWYPLSPDFCILRKSVTMNLNCIIPLHHSAYFICLYMVIFSFM